MTARHVGILAALLAAAAVAARLLKGGQDDAEPAAAPEPAAASGAKPPPAASATAEGYCMKERKKVEIAEPKAVKTKNGRDAVRGKCPDCGTAIFRMGKLPGGP
jgi:Domain of unknown function (DUF5679)